MRLTLAIATTASLAVASPDGLQAREGDCSPQVQGWGHVPTPDTAEEFLRSEKINIIIDNALTPIGYELAWEDINASMLWGGKGNGYLGLHYMKEFSPEPCHKLCEADPACMAFNIFAERGPSIDPGPKCEDPPSVNLYKCTLWGFPITKAMALNDGQYRGKFHVVIKGSYAYVNTQRAKDELVLEPHVLERPWDSGMNITPTADSAPRINTSIWFLGLIAWRAFGWVL